MIDIIMVTVFFVIFILITVACKKKQKIEFQNLEYSEWMKIKGFVKVKIKFIEDDIVYKNIDVVTNNTLNCYMNAGVFNFLLKKHTYSDIEVYPDKPNNKNIKETTSFIINTGIIESASIIDE